MKNKKKKNRILLLFLILTGISIGFAALTANLKINGSTTIAKNTWNIYWDNIANESGVTPNEATTINSDENSVPASLVLFNVTFDKPGDFYEFEVDAVNAGTLDAEVVSIEKKYNDTVIPEVEDPLDPVLPKYFKYTIKYADGNEINLGDRLAKRTSATVFTRKTYKVRVEYDKEQVTNEDINNQVGVVNHTFAFKVQYGQADPLPLIQLPQGKNKDTLAVGDEICINGATKECFDFVRYDGDDAVLLAKYNLNINGNTQPGTLGIQNALAIGDNNDSSYQVDGKYPATVYFSDSMYWNDGGIKPKYGSSYPADIYDPSFSGAPGSGTYSIAYYVEPYKTLLEGSSYGVTIKDIRLLTDSEITDPSIGCSHDTYNCPAGSFILNTSFWLQTAGIYGYDGRDMIVIVRSWNYFNSSMFANNMDGVYGVRPVIVIEKSNLK